MPAGDVTSPGTDVIIDADILAKNLASPAVVVSGQPENLHSTVAQVRQCSQRTEARAGNDRFPLEPEVEEIAVDDERCSFALELAQKSNERPLDFACCNADVRVRYEVAGRSWHLAIVAGDVVLHK